MSYRAANAMFAMSNVKFVDFVRPVVYQLLESGKQLEVSFAIST